MDAQLAGDTARELDKPVAALALGLRLLEGIDQAAAALTLDERRPYSPLRTIFEQGLDQAQRVRTLLHSHGTPTSELPPTP